MKHKILVTRQNNPDNIPKLKYLVTKYRITIKNITSKL